MELKPKEEFPSLEETLYKINGTLMLQNKLLEEQRKVTCAAAHYPFVPVLKQ